MSSAFATLALTASFFIGAVPAGATVTPLQIGVDNAGPSGHNFEYVDFFPRASAAVHDGGVVDFAWNSGAADGFHTVSIVPLFGNEATPAKVWSNHPVAKPDSDDSSTSLQFNPELLANQPAQCQRKGDSATNPCEFSGGTLVSSAGLPTTSGAHFFVRFSLEADLPVTVHFVCLIHPGMQGSLTVVDSETAQSTQTQLNAAAAAQKTADDSQALAAEGQANSTSVTTNNDNTRTVTMTAGTATTYVEVAEMLPNRVDLRPGDKVKWVTQTQKDIHTVTFPQGHGSDSVDPLAAPACEAGSGQPDTPATGSPPTFGCTTFPEFPLNWQPAGGTVINSTTRVATSGLLANIPNAPFPNNYTFSFPTIGTFTYMCRIHDHMIGAVVVNPPPSLPQTGRGHPSSSWPTGLAMLIGAGLLLVLAGVGGVRVRSKPRI